MLNLIKECRQTETTKGKVVQAEELYKSASASFAATRSPREKRTKRHFQKPETSISAKETEVGLNGNLVELGLESKLAFGTEPVAQSPREKEA